MVIYKNDYKIEEDKTLWELHEIRQVLYKELGSKSISEINSNALEKYRNWKVREEKKLDTK